MDAEESYRLILDEYYPTFKNELLDEALYTALDALQKQIPKALFKTKETLRCPTCKRHITNTGQKKENIKYCCKCGQALDWNSVQVEEKVEEFKTYNYKLDNINYLTVINLNKGIMKNGDI